VAKRVISSKINTVLITKMSYTNKENSVGGVKDEERMTIVQHYDIGEQVVVGR